MVVHSNLLLRAGAAAMLTLPRRASSTLLPSCKTYSAEPVSKPAGQLKLRDHAPSSGLVEHNQAAGSC
jgi:hypothetical protein